MRNLSVAVALVLVSGALAGCPKVEDGHEGHVPKAGGDAPHGSHAGHADRSGEGVSGYAPVTLPSERVQRIGVRTEEARREALTRSIRTVGIVRTDETREAHIHVKWSGWIEEFFVSFVGQAVRKGDPLFSVYSPDLVTAQQEFLIAVRRAGGETAGVPGKEPSGDALLAASRTKLRLWDVPEEAIQALEKGGELQRTVTVRAPRDGVVVERMALPGKFVEPAMDLYTIADLSRVWVLADLYEYEAPLVKIGSTARFSPVGVRGEGIAATVAFLAPTVDAMTRTVKARLEVPNVDGALRPGAYGTVFLDLPLTESVTVPSDAVIDTGARQVLFVKVGDGVFEPRAVRLGSRGGDRVQVLEGVRDGESVVTRAQFLLDSESRIRGAGTAPGHSGH